MGVSLTSDGHVRSGGGTTIYRNVADVPLECPQFIDMDAIFSSFFIVSSVYGDGSGTSYMNLVSIDADNTGKIVYSHERDGDVYEVITMSQSGGIFVAIEQDNNAGVNEAVVFAGMVQADGSKFTLGPSAYYSTSIYSMNPVITRLSDTSFALSYYDTVEGLAVMSTRVGKSS